MISTGGKFYSFLSGAENAEPWIATKEKWGNGAVKSADEMLEIMQHVAVFLKPESWQYCTINAWLNGNPSEDDVSWKAVHFTEMPLLEEVCGDHTTFGSQYKEAFDDLSSAGASETFVTWLNAKGTAAMHKKKAIAETEGKANFEHALEDFKEPFKFAGIGLGVLALVGLAVYFTSKTNNKESE